MLAADSAHGPDSASKRHSAALGSGGGEAAHHPSGGGSGGSSAEEQHQQTHSGGWGSGAEHSGSTDGSGENARSSFAFQPHAHAAPADPLPPYNFFSCTVGKKNSRAMFHLADSDDVSFLIAKFVYTLTDHPHVDGGGN